MKKRGCNIWGALFCAAGMICLLYFIFLLARMGATVTFTYFWLAAAFGFGGMGLALVFARGALGRLPRWLRFVVEGIVAAGCAVFILVEAVLIICGSKSAGEADYVIVLGAKVNNTSPSLILKARLDTALAYLNRYPNAKVIVSGGQGADEGISEAECMYRYLLAAGIAKERIIQEDRSTNTRENLEFSAQFLDTSRDFVVIITSDFHLFRSVRIAKKMGFAQVGGEAAHSLWYLVPTNYMREFLAVVKDFLLGNI